MSETLPVRWGTDTPVLVARCPEHGLRGLRDTCDECGGPVEQIALVSADWLSRCEHNVARANEAESALAAVTAERDEALDLLARQRKKCWAEPPDPLEVEIAALLRRSGRLDAS